jgi:hypothetical protein
MLNIHDIIIISTMSLPQRLYNLGCLIAKCELVRTKIATDDNRLELQNLLNETTPLSDVERAQHELVRGMYYSNQTEFVSYVNQPKNRVRALIYWTESKQIARSLGLLGKVHVKWSPESGYVVNVFVPRNLRETTDRPVQTARVVKIARRPVETSRPADVPVQTASLPVQTSSTLPGLTYSEAVKWCDATD